jgi:hypothetical protein
VILNPSHHVLALLGENLCCEERVGLVGSVGRQDVELVCEFGVALSARAAGCDVGRQRAACLTIAWML